jgi:hypothetical protein
MTMTNDQEFSDALGTLESLDGDGTDLVLRAAARAAFADLAAAREEIRRGRAFNAGLLCGALHARARAAAVRHPRLIEAVDKAIVALRALAE